MLISLHTSHGRVGCQPDKHDSYYHLYGGRGVTFCVRWMAFEAFFEDMGPRPEGLTLDRRDNNRGYELGNCRWATVQEQVANRRCCLTSTQINEICGRIEHGESRRSVAKRFGIATATVRRALITGSAALPSGDHV